MKIPRGYKQVLEQGFTEKDSVCYFINVPKTIRPSAKSMESSQNEEKWSYWREQNYAFFKESLKDTRESSVVADIGSGMLHFKKILVRFPALYTVDFFPYPEVNVVADVSNRLPFVDSSLDVLTLSNVLEHVPEPGVFLSECFRVLKKGGVLVGAVPFLIKVHQRPHDFYRYTDINLDYIFNRAGFSSNIVTPVLNLWNLLYSLMSRFFGRRIEKEKRGRLGKLFYRLLWKLVRFLCAVLKPRLQPDAEDKDYALGYHFRAVK